MRSITVFGAEQLDKTVRFLDEADFGGLISHLFAVRAFVPSGDAFESVREQLRDALDRLFIKLRLPNYVVAPREIETPAMRTALLGTLEALERTNGDARAPEAGAVTLSGSLDASRLPTLRAQLEHAAASTAAFWYVLAHFVPDSTPAFSAYRTTLVAHFEGLVDEAPQDFVDALQRRPAPALDAALRDVKSGLLALA